MTTQSSFFSRMGGKGRISNWVIAMLPQNYKELHYIEPFCGGATVLLNKLPSKVETINDLDGHLMNFWRVFKDDVLHKKLLKKLEYYIHSQDEWKRCVAFCNDNPVSIDIRPEHKVELAYCYWVKTQDSFCYIGDSYGYVKDSQNANNRLVATNSIKKIKDFDRFYHRIKEAQVFCEDSVKLIKRLDNKTALFYCDPPYPETAQRYKNKYSKQNFIDLMAVLRGIKGKFLLSVYKKPWMNFKGLNTLFKHTYISANAWSNKRANSEGGRKECLVSNYNIPHNQIECFK